MSKNIVLIGMRGSGKTTIAKLLSKKLNKEFLELDDILVKKEGSSIRELVSKKGWDYFRDKESEIVKEVLSLNNKIISTGGGVVVRNQNIETLRKNGVLIYLKASLNTLLKRIGEDKNRPPLTDKKNTREEIEEVLRGREELYKNSADEIIVTDDLNEEQTAVQIIKQLNNLTM
ncbi:MAG: shikimate kinase [Candidatus Levybacteria bacterium]|nr:shikimate kinase [Candidatus Levybacteria bacterium]